jgi:hypothetical protein
MAALNGLTADGPFIGQTPAFFALLTQLARQTGRTEISNDRRQENVPAVTGEPGIKKENKRKIKERK